MKTADATILVEDRKIFNSNPAFISGEENAVQIRLDSQERYRLGADHCQDQVSELT